MRGVRICWSGLTGGSVQRPAAQHLQASVACEGQRLHRSETSDGLQPETSAAVLLTQLTERDRQHLVRQVDRTHQVLLPALQHNNRKPLPQVAM